jgi:hypothetical protein
MLTLAEQTGSGAVMLVPCGRSWPHKLANQSRDSTYTMVVVIESSIDRT